MSLDGSLCRQIGASHFQILDCLWQVWQLDVLEISSLDKSGQLGTQSAADLDLLWNVHIFD